MNLLNSVYYFIPELVLIAEAIIIILASMMKGKKLVRSFALMGLATAFLLLITIRHREVSGGLFSGIIAIDNFSIFFKGLCILVTFITVLFSTRIKSGQTEYYAILLLSTSGMCLMAGANDLLIAYIAIEAVSISSYILTSFLKGDKKSSEAGLKYVIYGAIASGVMIYGMSFLYGVTGSTNFTEINKALQSAQSYPLMLATILMVMAGFGYKIAAVPFHMWCPDVYEGAPTPITAFLSVGPKAAGFAILIRLLWKAFFYDVVDVSGITVIWQSVLVIICVLTMTVGNLSALKQTNLKRLLAYSSIAHCGYMLMGLVLFTTSGIQAIMIYFVVYLFMNLGAFLVVIAISELAGTDDISGYKGLGWKLPLPAVIMAIFLFSLTGLPPFGGFIGKLYIFSAVIEKQWYLLAIIGALNSAVSFYYYARVIKAMFLEDASQNSEFIIHNLSFYYSFLLIVLVIPVVVLGVYWTPLLQLVQMSLSR
jgi:NADH-quinone oxidoreductase subunit N